MRTDRKGIPKETKKLENREEESTLKTIKCYTLHMLRKKPLERKML